MLRWSSGKTFDWVVGDEQTYIYKNAYFISKVRQGCSQRGDGPGSASKYKYV